ncbi:hypothetical protein WR25_18036 [Diploscapter pachys]|uniref:Transmembrane protein 161B n=1 Tax=Diploscapter pachys TaxID=2018661 RepID=A0A2A2JDW7_9BILA|nr:hypothetical protein WR25_18036 [Diploscapter pachys]
MAVLGFHLVITLVLLAVISKIKNTMAFVKFFVTKGLYRFIAPSNEDLRTLLPARKENPRARKKRMEEEDNDGFNVSKQSPFTLKICEVSPDDLQRFQMYDNLHWLCVYVPTCFLVYAMSEVFLYLMPDNSDFNVSLLWLICAIFFILQAMVSLTAYLFRNEDERGLLLTFGALYFLCSCIFTMSTERYFDVALLSAYDRFNENLVQTMLVNGVETDASVKPQSPLLLYISLSIFFSFLSAMHVFPCFRYALMYLKSNQQRRPIVQLANHVTFVMPAIIILLFIKPVKEELIGGRRKLLTEDQLQILRIYLVFLWAFLRFLAKGVHLQAHLNLAHDKVLQLQQETGYIKNYQLQTIIFRYYSYFCCAALQYFTPVLLTIMFSLLLKTTCGLSWLCTSSLSASASSAPALAATNPIGVFRSVFDPVVCRAIWSYLLIMLLLIDFSLSSIGVIYHTYFVR